MKKILLSNRARLTPTSPIRKLAKYANQAKEKGIKVYHFNIGQPDINSPIEFFNAIKEFNNPVIAYEDSRGNQVLRNTWSNYLNKNYNLGLTENNFIITMGASESLLFIFMSCCDPGDEVIVFDPTYANYISFAAESGVDLIPVLSDLENNFTLPSKDEIEKKITNRTRAILLCNPNNPTGTVYNEDDIKFLLNICEEHNFFLVVDEAYREFVYDGLKPKCALQIDPLNERIIIIDSLSKRYSLCGARLGALITKNQDVLSTVLHIAQARLCAPTIEQYAAAKTIEKLPDAYLENIRKEYELRRNILFDAICQINGIVAYKPEGAFYMTVQFPIENVEDFAIFLLTEFSYENKTCFIAPGAGFYMQNGKGDNKARLAYVINKDDIKDGIFVLQKGLESYLKKQEKLKK